MYPTSFTVIALDAHGLSTRLHQSSVEFEPPAWLAEQPEYQSTLANVKRRVLDGTCFDGLRHPVVDVAIREGCWHMTCAAVRYSQAVAMDAARRRLAAQTQAPTPLFPIASNVGSASGVITSVLTADGLLLVHQRSARVGDSPLKWAVAFGEGVDASDIQEMSMEATSHRCLREELGLEDADLAQFIRLVAIVRNNFTLVWDGYAIADFRGLDPAKFGADALIAKAAGAADGWEHASMVGVPLAEAPRFMAAHDTTEATPYFMGALRAYLGHVHPV